MDKTIRNALLLGLGAASLTKKQIKTQIDKLVKNGNLNAKEGEEMVRKLINEGQKQRKNVDALVKRELKRVHAFTKDLEKRIGKLISDAESKK